MIAGRVAAIWRYAVKSMAGERLESCTLGENGIPGDRGWAVRDEEAGEIRNARKLPGLLMCEARYPVEPRGDAVSPAEIRLPDGSLLASDAPDAAERLTKLLGRRVTLWPRQPADDLGFYRRGRWDTDDVASEVRAIMGRLEDDPFPDFSRYPRELAGFACRPGTFFDAYPLHLATTASLRHLEGLQSGIDADPRRFRLNLLIETPGGASGPVELDWCGRSLEIGAVRVRVEAPTVRCSIPAREQRDVPQNSRVLRSIVQDMAGDLGVYASVATPGPVRIGDEVRLD